MAKQMESAMEKIRGYVYVAQPLVVGLTILVLFWGFAGRMGNYPDDQVLVVGKYFFLIIGFVTFALGLRATELDCQHVECAWAEGRKFDWI